MMFEFGTNLKEVTIYDLLEREKQIAENVQKLRSTVFDLKNQLETQEHNLKHQIELLNKAQMDIAAKIKTLIG